MNFHQSTIDTYPFDGELENILTEKHVQAFEHFADLFEIEHDDVLMRVFS